MMALDTIAIYLVEPATVTDERLLADYAALLSEAELTRWRRFVFPADRHDFLVSHALMRAALSRHAPVPLASWTFASNQYGRPEIVGPEVSYGLQFNLSHTKGLAAVAVAKNRRVGIDVENVTREPTNEVSGLVFTADEIRTLQTLAAPQQRDRFFDLWTLKEAYSKARGLGHAIPFRGFCFDLAAPPPIRIAFTAELADDPSRWQFELLSPTAAHRLAIAYEATASEVAQVTVEYLTPGESA